MRGAACRMCKSPARATRRATCRCTPAHELIHDYLEAAGHVRIDGHNQLPKLIQGATFAYGIEIAAILPPIKPKPPNPSGRHQNSPIALTHSVSDAHRGAAHLNRKYRQDGQ
jgi:hypothetical protein